MRINAWAAATVVWVLAVLFSPCLAQSKYTGAATSANFATVSVSSSLQSLLQEKMQQAQSAASARGTAVVAAAVTTPTGLAAA
jgi:membrane-bound ClpP family serine protease